jgi:hypothetical protein
VGVSAPQLVAVNAAIVFATLVSATATWVDNPVHEEFTGAQITVENRDLTAAHST